MKRLEVLSGFKRVEKPLIEREDSKHYADFYWICGTSMHQVSCIEKYQLVL